MAGGILTLGAPWLAILAAVAGVVAKVKIEIVRDVEATPPGDQEPAKTEAPADTDHAA